MNVLDRDTVHTQYKSVCHLFRDEQRPKTTLRVRVENLVSLFTMSVGLQGSVFGTVTKVREDERGLIQLSRRRI